MTKTIFLFLMMIGVIIFSINAHAAKIQMGDQKFEGKVVVHQDGSVTTESTAKEVDVEGQGKKRLKLKFKEGKLMVADEQGEEMALEEGGKFKKRALIKERRAQTADKTTVATGTAETQGTATTINPAQDKKTMGEVQKKSKSKETSIKKQVKKIVKKDMAKKTKVTAKKTTQKKHVDTKGNKKTTIVEGNEKKIIEEKEQ